MNDLIMQAQHVKRAFPVGDGEFWALKDISIDVPEQSLTILKGRSGSGKTTLLNALSTLDKPTSGEIIFRGRSFGSMTEADKERLRREEIGFIFQSVALVPIMNAYENIDFPMRLAKIKGNHDERIKEVLGLVGMEKRIHHMPGQLSGGEQQRIAIARAIAHRPRLLFADEPTGALDTENGLQVMQLFRELIQREGVTIVMTTHDPNLMKMGDIIYEIEDGELVGKYEN